VGTKDFTLLYRLKWETVTIFRHRNPKLESIIVKFIAIAPAVIEIPTTGNGDWVDENQISRM
jgi:hypothetical protein